MVEWSVVSVSHPLACKSGAIPVRQERSASDRKRRVSSAEGRAGESLHTLLVKQGLLHHQRGQRDLAESCYQRALATEPDHADALHYLGLLHHQEGRSSAAADLIAKAVSIRPNDAAASNNLGVALEALGRREEALGAYDRAVAIQPDYAEAWNHRGGALLSLARPSEALNSCDRALALKPAYAEALNNRGIALHGLGRFAEAITSFDRALEARANFAKALNNRGSALLALGDAARALESFDRALAFNPRYAEALFNRGNALVELKRYDAAIDGYDRALAVRPNYAKALNNRGNALKDQGRLEEAVVSYRRALAVKPDYSDAHSNLLFAQHYMHRISNAELLAEARRFGETLLGNEIRKPHLNDRSQTRRLRIGYVSGNFRSHPVGFFLAAVLESHNRDVVEVFCYTNGQKIDRMTNRLRGSADAWRNIVGMSDDAAAAMIFEDRIDILVDLAAHTSYNRLPMFALRPAPIQVSWLGSPGPTGVSAIDYKLMDKFAVRPGEDHWYTEKVVRLPHARFCYSPPDYAPSLVDPPSLRRGFVTFGSFNNIAKVGPEVVKLWAAVLLAVPKSRLLVKWRSLDDEATRRRFSDAFASAGVDESRLVLQGHSPHAELMTQYEDIDIALDTFPYSGGLTTCEAFWMGVPVVTFTGDAAASRHVLGAFYDLGLSDCVANSGDQYLERASALARDPARLSALRRSLRTNMTVSPLGDGKRFTAALERAYEVMWGRWRCGENPAAFHVPQGHALVGQNP